MDALSIERASLVGNSFGGAVALRAAFVAPARVSALVLISAPAPGLAPSPELLAAWEAEETALQSGDVEAAVVAVVDAWTLPEALDGVRERVAVMQRRAFAVQTAAPAATEAADPVEDQPRLLSRLDIPTLVVAGEHDKGDFREGAEVLASTLPRARRAVIEGAGHLAPLETPQAFTDLVLTFLESV